MSNAADRCSSVSIGCIGNELQFEIGYPCRKSWFLATVVFVCPGPAHARSFLALSPPLLLGLKIISPLNSTKLSTSDRMDEMNFRNPKNVSGLAFHRLELLISGELSPKKAPLRNVRFPSVSIGCSKTFTAGCEQDTGKPLFLVLAAPTLETAECFTTKEPATHTSMGLPSTTRSSVVYNWVYDTVYYYKKTKFSSTYEQI